MVAVPPWPIAGLVLLVLGLYAIVPRAIATAGIWLGRRLRRRTRRHRDLLFSRLHAERQKAGQSGLEARPVEDGQGVKGSRGQSDHERNNRAWEGVIGFFHPFCNAGGGGERVLWAAIRATQQQWPNAICAVYTGDHDADKEQMLARVEDRFNIHLTPQTITFLYLSTRRYVLSSTWPHFTLLGQSLGSLVLGYDAFGLLVPDIFIDTMGYAFTASLSKFLFPDVPTAAYVHYPTISTDMLDSLAAPEPGRGANAGAGRGWKGHLKRRYWHLFARLYGHVGGSVDVVMTNSSWTQAHIQKLWTGARERSRRPHPVEVVFPPVAVEDLVQGIELTRESERRRRDTILYIAQFRPEKDHQLVLRAFARLLRDRFPAALAPADPSPSAAAQGPIPQLTLIGSVRDAADEKHIYALRLLAHELHITPHVAFVLNASWDAVLAHLRTASIGVNGMWNEHFGIGVVEYQAAGLVGVVHDSGGPRRDICVDVGDGEGGAGPTGFHASDVEGFARGFETVLCGLGGEERFRMRLRARRSSLRFSGRRFDERWLVHMERLVELRLRAGTGTGR